MAIDNEAGEERVGGQLLPDDVRMPRQHRRAAVAEMGRQRRTCRNRIGDLPRGRATVWPIATLTPVDTQPLDELERARNLRRERHEHDAAAGRVLPAREVVRTRRPHVCARMRAARAVLWRDVRPFHVDPCDGRVRDAMRWRPRAAAKSLERRGDERRQQARDAGRRASVPAPPLTRSRSGRAR